MIYFSTNVVNTLLFLKGLSESKQVYYEKKIVDMFNPCHDNHHMLSSHSVYITAKMIYLL
jgi:hypothetical protein